MTQQQQIMAVLKKGVELTGKMPIFVEGLDRSNYLLKAVAKPVALFFCLASFKISIMQNEIWKDVPGYEGLYQVSNMARIKSLSHKRWSPRNNCYCNYKEIILRQSKDSGGYYSVAMHKNKKQKTVKTSTLVAMAFLNHVTNGRFIVVDHIDNDKENDNLYNIQVITARENSSKDRKNKTSKYTGVHFEYRSKKWVSAITVNGKHLKLGSFEDEKEASLYYINAVFSIRYDKPIKRHRPKCASIFKNITFDKSRNKWTAQRQENKQYINYGRADTEHAAVMLLPEQYRFKTRSNNYFDY